MMVVWCGNMNTNQTLTFNGTANTGGGGGAVTMVKMVHGGNGSGNGCVKYYRSPCNVYSDLTSSTKWSGGGLLVGL